MNYRWGQAGAASITVPNSSPPRRAYCKGLWRQKLIIPYHHFPARGALERHPRSLGVGSCLCYCRVLDAARLDGCTLPPARSWQPTEGTREVQEVG